MEAIIYRPVLPEEVYQKGDEISDDGIAWEDASGLYGCVRMSPAHGGFQYARRRVEPVFFKLQPPLGLKPRKLHEEERHKEVLAAIQRCIQADKMVPVEWFQEALDYLCENGRLNNK